MKHCKKVYIALSGIDGSGKTTYGEMLTRWIKSTLATEVIYTDGLKPCEFSSKLRNISSDLNVNYFDFFGDISLIAFALDLINSYENKIDKNRQLNQIVITHRNKLCCKTYSSLRDYSNSAYRIIDKILESIPDPDFYFYFDVSPEIAMHRIENRIKLKGGEKSINENIECLIKLKSIYEKKINECPVPVYRFNTEKASKIEILNQMIEITNEFIK